MRWRSRATATRSARARGTLRRSPMRARRWQRARIILSARLTGAALEEVALGWLLAGYRFGRYKDAPAPKAELVAPAGRRCRPARGDRGGRGADPRSDQHARLRHGAGRARGRRRGPWRTSSTRDFAVTDGRRAACRELPDDPCRRPGLDPRAAADRPGLGRQRAAADAGRQGRLFRHRRAQPQARRLDGADEEGHGRRGHGAGARAHDHGARAAAAAAGADPGGGERGRAATPCGPATC